MSKKKKDIIGQRTRVQIGGKPPKEDDAIVGEDVIVYVSSDAVGEYGSITGKKIEVRVGSDVDEIVQEIMSTVQSSQAERRDEIVAICREILEEENRKSKLDKITTLISATSGIAQIAQLGIQLTQWLQAT